MVARISGSVGVLSEIAILDEISKNNAISIAVQLVSREIMFYKSGVYKGSSIENDATNGNHAITVIGYDITGKQPFYIVKNSWGNIPIQHNCLK